MLKPDYYYQDMEAFYKFCIPPERSVLRLENERDIFGIRHKFDYVVLPDIINRSKDIQKLFHRLKFVCNDNTRLIINFYNFLWSPLLILAEWLGLKKKQNDGNWVSFDDISNLLKLEGFEVVNYRRRLLLPVNLPLISEAVNRYLANLPLINHLCLNHFIIFRPVKLALERKLSVSVVVPAKNEQGNIENVVKSIPPLGKHTQIIFVAGHSSDDTTSEIKRVIKKYPQKDILLVKQKGKGKADAVRLGFKHANGEVLMIFDADLSVGAEELPKFYAAIASGKGEFINGSRLVYPMEKMAMRMLNIFGNKFFSVVFSWMLGQRIKDTLCGTKVISRDNYNNLAQGRKYFGDFDPFGDFDLIFGAAKLNLKFIEIPIKYRARRYGKTNISRFRHGWLLLKMTWLALKKLKFI